MNMVRIYSGILSMLVMSQMAWAQVPRPLPPGDLPSPDSKVTVAKTMDGTTVYCEAGMQPLPGQKAILIEKLDHWEADKSIGFNLDIKLVSCSSRGWVLDSSPREEEYYASNGQHVRVRYDNYEAFLLDSKNRVIWQRRLGLDSRGRDANEFEIKKPKKISEDYVVFVRSKKSLYVDGRYQFTEFVPFGSFNVRVSR